MLQETRLAGYRVLRALGSGERAEVLLGAGDAEPVAIKRFLPTVPLERVLFELDAIERIDAPHLPRVLDLATGPEGAPVLVLERWSPFTLGALLARRRTVSAGEAVTLLAPIAETIERMHAAGWAHGAIGPGAVHLAVDGAPVLSGLSALVRFAPGNPSEAVRHAAPAVAEDVQALTALAATVAEHLEPAGAALRRRLEELAVAPVSEPQRRAYELLETLFGAAPAAAVRFPGSGRRSAGETGSTPSVRESPDVPADGSADPEGGERPVSGPIGWLAAAQLPEWLERLIDLQGSAVQRSAPLRRIRATLGSVRPRFRVLGAITVLALLALGGVALQRAGDERSSAAEIATPSVGAHDGAVGSDADAGRSPTGSQRGGGAAAATEDVDDPGAASASAGTEHDAAVHGDEPLDAAAALLALRDDCLARAEHACLDGVLQAGSALLREDRARVDAVQRDGTEPERLGTPAELAVVQEFGGAVLLSAAFPEAAPETAAASLLIVRSEAGWRLRDLL